MPSLLARRRGDNALTLPSHTKSFLSDNDHFIGSMPAHSPTYSFTSNGHPSPHPFRPQPQPAVNQYDRMFGLPAAPSRTSSDVPDQSADSLAYTSTEAAMASASKQHKPSYPPPSASTGSSASAGSFLRRAPSFRRRTDTNKNATRLNIQPQSIIPSQSASTDQPSLRPRTPSAAEAKREMPSKRQQSVSSSGNGFSRFFTLRKRAQSTSFAKVPFNQAISPPPVPIARESPPIAIISTDWQSSKVEKESGFTVLKRKLSVTKRRSQLGSGGQHAFSFPSKQILSSAVMTRSQSHKEAVTIKARYIPGLSTPVSSTTTPTPCVSMAETISGSTLNRKPSLSPTGHRANSLSLHVLDSFLGSSTNPLTNADEEAESKPSTRLTRSFSKRDRQGQVATKRPSTTGDMNRRSATSPTLVDATRPKPPMRKASIVSRLRIGRLNSSSQMNRPSTPEIESWKQKDSPSVEGHRRRAIINAIMQDAPAVKISRSRSSICRKPPPEITQHEIETSPITPMPGLNPKVVYVDQNDGLVIQMDGDIAASFIQDSLPPWRRTSLGLNKSSPKGSRSQSRDGNVHSLAPTPSTELPQPAPGNRASGLGMYTDSLGDAEESPVPVHQQATVLVSATTPRLSSDSCANSKVTSQEESNHEPTAKLSNLRAQTGDTSLSSNSPALLSVPSPAKLMLRAGNTSPKPSLNSVGDVSSDGERPWSLISSVDTDTPLLRLRKLIVDTNSPGDRAKDGNFFFKPLQDRDVKEEIATPKIERDSVDEKLESISLPSVSESRASSPSTTRSELKEISSIHSSGSSTIKVGKVFAQQPLASVAAAQAAKARGQDALGPLPAKSPISPANNPWSGSNPTSGKRASVASGLTASSGQFSEGRLSEDALSALEAQVGQARRTEVVALGKGRVADWVGDSSRLHQGPTLSRSGTLKKKKDIEEKEQSNLIGKVDEKLATAADQGVLTARQSIQEDGLVKHKSHFDTLSKQPPTTTPCARLSALHDGKVDEPRQPVIDQAIRLGLAPCKRVRRSEKEAKSAGEAVMVAKARSSSRRGSEVKTKHTTIPERSVSQLGRSKSMTSTSTRGSNPTIGPIPISAAAAARGHSDDLPRPSKSKRPAAIYATSEEAALAKQREHAERAKRHGERERKRQAEQQRKYALKKKSDPLLAARLALVGLQNVEPMPLEESKGKRPEFLDLPQHYTVSPSSSPIKWDNVPILQDVPRRTPTTEGMLSAPSWAARGASPSSFHTANDTLVSARPDTSASLKSIASSLTVDFEFPIPPQRAREQLSDDGTLLSRAGLGEPHEDASILGTVLRRARSLSYNERTRVLGR